MNAQQGQLNPNESGQLNLQIPEKEKDENETLQSGGRLEKLMKQQVAQNMIGFGIIDDKALAAINRIKAKMHGTDFDPAQSLGVADQVEKLIRQASSIENICQSYMGWGPFL